MGPGDRDAEVPERKGLWGQQRAHAEETGEKASGPQGLKNYKTLGPTAALRLDQMPVWLLTSQGHPWDDPAP